MLTTDSSKKLPLKKNLKSNTRNFSYSLLSQHINNEIATKEWHNFLCKKKKKKVQMLPFPQTMAFCLLKII